MQVRAKFRCTSEASVRHSVGSAGHRVFTFQPMYDSSVPEDQRYFSSTPSGKLEITVDNPAVNWEPGRDYYLDFTPVES